MPLLPYTTYTKALYLCDSVILMDWEDLTLCLTCKKRKGFVSVCAACCRILTFAIQHSSSAPCYSLSAHSLCLPLSVPFLPALVPSLPLLCHTSSLTCLHLKLFLLASIMPACMSSTGCTACTSLMPLHTSFVRVPASPCASPVHHSLLAFPCLPVQLSLPLPQELCRDSPRLAHALHLSPSCYILPALGPGQF